MYETYMDLQKAYGRLDIDIMRGVLEMNRVNGKLINGIKNLYA